jgi:nitroreductase
MDTLDCIATKLDVREFAKKSVPRKIKEAVLESARLTASGINAQHWRFVLVQDPDNVKTLARDSTTGRWVENADFAVVVLTNPKLPFHLIDAGRAVQDMQLAAWNSGVASGVYTGIDRPKMTEDFGLPADLSVSMIVGFGYPAKKIIGKKSRKPIMEIAFSERYGTRLAL